MKSIEKVVQRKFSYRKQNKTKQMHTHTEKEKAQQTGVLIKCK